MFIWCNKFFANSLFPFLFKWISLIPLLSIKLIPFWMQKFFKQAFLSYKVFWMLILNLQMKTLETLWTVLLNELVFLLVSIFCFKRKLIIAAFSTSSFSKLDMWFFNISNSNGEFSLLLKFTLLFSEMFWSSISSSFNFSSIGFVNRFISSISFRRFWNKTKLTKTLTLEFG